MSASKHETITEKDFRESLARIDGVGTIKRCKYCCEWPNIFCTREADTILFYARCKGCGNEAVESRRCAANPSPEALAYIKADGFIAVAINWNATNRKINKKREKVLK